jgi:hypothetical protein
MIRHNGVYWAKIFILCQFTEPTQIPSITDTVNKVTFRPKEREQKERKSVQLEVSDSNALDQLILPLQLTPPSEITTF